MFRTVATLASVAILLVLTGCGAATPGSRSPTPATVSQSPAVTATAVPTPVFMSADLVQQIAQQADLSAGDLGPLSAHPPVGSSNGWSPLPGAGQGPANDSTGCIHPSNHVLGGWTNEFTYDLAPSGGEEGHGDAIVTVVDSAQDAAAYDAQVTTPGYLACYQPQVLDVLTGVGASITGSTTRTLETLNTGVPTHIVRFDTPYSYGGAKIDHFTAVWMQYGQYRAIVEIWTCCGPTPVSDLSTSLDTLAQRLQAAPEGVQLSGQ